MSSDSDPKTTFSMTIDLSRLVYLKGFTYMPRSERHDEKPISRFAFYANINSVHWGKISEGEFSNIAHNPILQSAEKEPFEA